MKPNQNPYGARLEWRVTWESLNGKFTTEWLTEYEARKKYNQLKTEVLLKTIWAELIFASIDDDAEDEVTVVESFARPTTVMAGHIVITGK